MSVAVKRYWSRHEIKQAISAFVEEHGRTPMSDEWKATNGEYPNTSIVRRRFGTWNKAIEAAGFTPRPATVVGEGEPTVHIGTGFDLSQEMYDRFVQKCEAEQVSLRKGIIAAVEGWCA